MCVGVCMCVCVVNGEQIYSCPALDVESVTSVFRVTRHAPMVAVQGFHIICSKTVSYNIIDCKNIVKKGAITTDLSWHNFVYLVAVTTPRVVNGATR